MSNTKLAVRLKEFRKMNQYNQEYVASYLDISRQAYSHYETGRNIPPTDALIKLAHLYQLPENELLSLTTSITSNTYSNLSNFEYLDDFIDFINKPENHAYHSLEKNEKLLLYFFQLLSSEDQEDLLSFLKIRISHVMQKKEKRS